MKYFQAVVRYQNFTKAAEECFISQSAISQQIQALKRELDVKLIIREGRKISLTQAGEYFYRKSLVLVSDFDRLCAETSRLDKKLEHELVIGYLRHYNGNELEEAIAEFNKKFPEVFLQLLIGTHEELYDYLRNGKADVVFSDLRRKPSDQYVNYFLAKSYFYAEVSLNNSLAQLETITMDDLKNTPVILIAPFNQKQSEELYYREYLGLKSEILFVENMEEAHLMVIANKGYFITDCRKHLDPSKMVKYLPIIHNDKQIYRKYYAFWRADTTKKYVEEFADIIHKNFKS